MVSVCKYLTIYVAIRQIYGRGLWCCERQLQMDLGQDTYFPEKNKTKLGENRNFKVCFNE